jgi:hypothetical protein
VRTSTKPSVPAPVAVRIRRLGRVGLSAGTLAAAWVAAGAPIHLGMITELLP